MNAQVSDDIYLFMYFDIEEKEISLSVANSLEEFKEASDAFDIVAWCNVTGKEIRTSKIHVQDVIKILEVTDNVGSEGEDEEDRHAERPD